MGGIKTGRGNRLWKKEYLYAKLFKICMFYLETFHGASSLFLLKFKSLSAFFGIVFKENSGNMMVTHLDEDIGKNYG
jgi:hypothetical protein